MSTITANKPTDPTHLESAPAKRIEPPLRARYVGAMLYFMGAALIAGGVVHYPIDPPQYTVITVVGAFVFALGTVFKEFVLAPVRPTIRRAVWAVTTSLFLSLGVGLTGGGIQHFDQFPERCAIMTPVGLALSYIAYVAKDPEGRWRDLVSRFAAGMAAVVVATWLGMSALAHTIDTTGHHHGGSEPSVTEPATPADSAEPATPTDPAEPTEQTNRKQPTKPVQQPHDDGHTDHHH